MSIIQQLNRARRREAQKALVKDAAKLPATLREVPRERWPAHRPNLLRVWQSQGYLVQEYQEADNIIRLSVNRVTATTSGNWEEDITWVQLQVLKRECGYGDRWAVEVFPADRSVVNVANMRHLWLLPAAPPYAWNSAALPTQEGGPR